MIRIFLDSRIRRGSALPHRRRGQIAVQVLMQDPAAGAGSGDRLERRTVPRARGGARTVRHWTGGVALAGGSAPRVPWAPRMPWVQPWQADAFAGAALVGGSAPPVSKVDERGADRRHVTRFEVQRLHDAGHG